MSYESTATERLLAEGLESQPRNTTQAKGRLTRYLEWGLGTLLVIIAIVGYASYRTGSLRLALPYLMGQRFFVAESKLSLGEVVCGTEVSSGVRLANLGSSPAAVIGARKSCSCIAVGQFPIEVPSGGERLIELRLQTPKSQTEFVYYIEIYVADREFSTFQIELSGTAIQG